MADSHSEKNNGEISQQNGKENADDSASGAGSKENTETVNTTGKGRHGDKIHASKGDHDDKKIFVGGLSYGTTEENLKKYFSKWGPIVDVEVKRGFDKRSRGFGFVLFEDAEDCAKALAEGKHELDKKTIDPKIAVAVTKPKKLFVGGISHEVSVDDIKEHFSKFGTITESEIPMLKEGKHKGFAFLLFEKSESVTNIVKDTYHYIKGKYRCEVKRAVSRDEHHQRLLYGHTGYYSQYPINYNYGYTNFGASSLPGRGRYRGRGGYPQSFQEGAYVTAYPAYGYGSGFGSGGGYEYHGGYPSHQATSNFYGHSLDYYTAASPYSTGQYSSGGGSTQGGFSNGNTGGYSSYSGQSYVKNSY